MSDHLILGERTDTRPMHDYALVIASGIMLIGRTSIDDAGLHLGPVFEASVQYQFDEHGNFGIIRQCMPVVGSTTVKEVMVPAGAIIIPVSSLSSAERKTWVAAWERCESLVKAMKSAESGIITARADVQLPPPPGVLLK